MYDKKYSKTPGPPQRALSSGQKTGESWRSPEGAMCSPSPTLNHPLWGSFRCCRPSGLGAKDGHTHSVRTFQPSPCVQARG